MTVRDTLRGVSELERGPLVLDGGGGYFLQPAIRGRRLDDVVGQRFIVLGRSARHVRSTASRWSQRLGALVTTLEEIDDPTRPLKAWMDRREVDVVVVRPDRFVLACGGDLESITRAVEPILLAAPVGHSR